MILLDLVLFERFNILISTWFKYILKHWMSSVEKYFSNDDLVLDCLLFITLLYVLPMEIWSVFFCSQVKWMDIERRSTVSECVCLCKFQYDGN